jgi:hypothetical protein
MPFGPVDLLAIFDISFISGHGDIADGHSGLGVFYFRIFSHSPDNHYLIQTAGHESHSLVEVVVKFGGMYGLPWFASC